MRPLPAGLKISSACECSLAISVHRLDLGLIVIAGPWLVLLGAYSRLINTRDLKRAWKKKGFLETDREDEYEVCYPNTMVKTHCSNGPTEDLRDTLTGKIAHQMHLTKNQLHNFVQCPLSQAQYEQILKDAGYLP